MVKTNSLLIALALLSACAVGPDYERPPVDTTPAFKESGDWQPAAPQDDADRGVWWSIYNDPVLNDLEQQVDISNQNLKASEAAYRAAQAAVEQATSGLFPTVTANASPTRSGVGSHYATYTYDLSAGLSWTIDVWGRIRREIENAEANAEVSEADLANARLSAQATLATDYFALRAQDEVERLLDLNVADDRKILTIIQNQYKVGVAAQSDVLSAQTQLESTQASAINSRLTRAQLEHAIAVLTGKPPADFTLMATKTVGDVPFVPPAVPSDLLQRRPDIAAAERGMAAANANVGVAVAAWYPNIALSASYGFSATTASKLFNAANSLWSFGATASETLLDFGARSGAEDQAKATYDQSVATYRQTVLTAFQNVEDNLAAQRVLADQEKVQSAATADSRKSETIALNQYKQGIVPYNNVLLAQITRLTNEQASANLRNSRLSASVALIEALGGGWNATQLTQQ